MGASVFLKLKDQYGQDDMLVNMSLVRHITVGAKHVWLEFDYKQHLLTSTSLPEIEKLLNKGTHNEQV